CYISCLAVYINVHCCTVYTLVTLLGIVIFTDYIDTPYSLEARTVGLYWQQMLTLSTFIFIASRSLSFHRRPSIHYRTGNIQKKLYFHHSKTAALQYRDALSASNTTVYSTKTSSLASYTAFFVAFFSLLVFFQDKIAFS